MKSITQRPLNRVCLLCIPVILAMTMPAGCTKPPDAPKAAVRSQLSDSDKAATPSQSGGQVKAQTPQELSDAEKAAMPIVSQNAVARGGLDNWRGVRSMRMSGRMDAGKVRSVADIQGVMKARPVVAVRAAASDRQKENDKQERTVQLPFVMEMERPRKMRLEIAFQGQTAVQVYDGTRGWKLRPFLNRHEVENYSAEELRLASEQQDLDGPLIDYERKGSRVELEGTEPVDGRDAYKLKVTLQDGQVRHVWVDKESYLDVKSDGTRTMDGKRRPTATHLRDYKSVNGLMIPFVMETSVEGVSGSNRIVVENLSLNNPIDETRFGKPN